MTFHAGSFGFAQPGTTFGDPGGPVTFGPSGNGGSIGGVVPSLPDPFAGIPDAGDTIIDAAHLAACAVSKPIGCNHPLSRPVWEQVCGPCDVPIGGVLDPDNLGEIVPSQPTRPSRPAGSCVPCGPNECISIVGVDKCGNPRTRKGRLQVDPSTGAAVCVPKKPRMNPMNAKANRRSMTRLKGAHREAKKIIDTLDTFAKPRRSKAPRARAAAASCACK